MERRFRVSTFCFEKSDGTVMDVDTFGGLIQNLFVFCPSYRSRCFDARPVEDVAIRAARYCRLAI